MWFATSCAIYWVHPAEILRVVKLNDETVKQIITSVYGNFGKFRELK